MLQPSGTTRGTNGLTGTILLKLIRFGHPLLQVSACPCLDSPGRPLRAMSLRALWMTSEVLT